MNAPRREPADVAGQLWRERFPRARLLFCGGSVVRGEGLPSSDLDVVVLFDSVNNAWRESFRFEGWPVEIFAHDSETLVYFAQESQTCGRPSLAQMVGEALVFPEPTELSIAIQSWARSMTAAKPAVPAPAALDQERYFLSDLLEDFSDPRPRAELRAIACQLYPLVSNFVLKSRGEWLGSGKTLPRFVARVAPELGEALELAFDAFFKTEDPEPVIRFVHAVLEPFGGPLFDGFRSEAPAASRVSSSDVPWRLTRVP